MSFSAAAGNVAPTVIHTDAQGLVHGDFRLPVADGSIDAYYAAPEGKRDLPVVLVIQEIFGVHEHIKDVCRRVAKAGYLAVAANLYERQGDASTYTDIPKLIAEIVSKVPDEQVFADLDASVAWAAQHGGDPKRVAVTGFCWGGAPDLDVRGAQSGCEGGRGLVRQAEHGAWAVDQALCVRCGE